jgi:hypothetical protein
MSKSTGTETFLSFWFVIMAGCCTSSYALPTYTISDLGQAQGDARPLAVNNAGQVTGAKEIPSGEAHAFSDFAA